MSIYIGVDGKARKVKSAYIGVNGKAQIIYTGSDVPSTYIPYTYIYRTDYQYADIEKSSVNTNTFTQIICDFKLSKVNAWYIYNGINMATYENIFEAGNMLAYIKFATDSKAYCIIKKNESLWTSSALTANTIYTINLTKNTNGDCYFGSNKIFSNVDANAKGTSIRMLGDANNESAGWYHQAYSAVYIKGLTGYSLTENKYIFDFRPCVKSNGSSTGMYDKISGSFTNEYSQYLRCTN